MIVGRALRDAHAHLALPPLRVVGEACDEHHRVAQTKAGYWGVYMTPREKALETDGIFSMLYFEPVHVPGAAGSPAEIIEHFKENLDVVNKSVDDVNGRIAALWQKNAEKVQLLYDTACYYAAVYDLRRMAAVKGQHFFCVGSSCSLRTL